MVKIDGQEVGPSDGFVKADDGKPALELLNGPSMMELGAVLGHGARKYNPDNWKKGGVDAIPRFIGAALRHIFAYKEGQQRDPESGGGHHIAHAMASLMFIIGLESEAGLLALRQGPTREDGDD